MAIATLPATATRNDGSVLVCGYTWQCAWSTGEFWQVGMADEAYSEDSYFDELDTLDEAIEFICGGQSDADIEAALLD